MVTKPWVWVPQFDKTCVTPKVGSTFSPTCAFNYITIDGNGETINPPSSAPPGVTNTVTLDITYTGNFTPSFSSVQWQNKTAPAACGGVTTNCLSSTNGTFDRIVGQIDATRGVIYGAVITNYGAPALPLDVATGATFGYGLRKLRAAYTGSALNIRRATGTPTNTDIGFDTSGNFDSSAFNSFCSGTTCFLATWYEQSGSGAGNCVQATAANQLQVTLSSLGGRASLVGTGSAGSRYCTVATNTLLDFTGSGHTVLFVAQYTATNDGGGTAGGRGDALEVVSHYNSGTFAGWAADAGDTSRPGAVFVFTSNGSIFTSDGASGHLTAMNDGNPHFAGWSFASGTVKIFQDAATYTSATAFQTPTTSGQPMTLMAAGDVPVDAFFSGNLGEIYAWPTTLTAVTVGTIQAGASLYY